MIALRFLALIAIVYLLQGCAAEPVDMVLRPSPEFQPVYPLASDRQKVATGGIYSNRQSDAWFGRGRNYQVGDIITVLLNESTQAARTQNTDVSRESKNTNSSKGEGKAGQQASLAGSVAVTVVEILANGNLMVRGEKKLGLSEGTEVIQVSGVIRPEDVGPNSTVQSRRLANAQIAYRGSGDLANATKAGWGTSLMHKYWPF